MSRLLLWTWVLLVMWVVSGCGKAGDKHAATIVITEGNSLLYKRAGQNQPVTYYGPGDSVLVEWRNDTCYVNGRAHMPPSPAQEILAIEHLRSFYGKVPSVVEFVNSHAGDSTEVWNQAYREWERQIGQVTRAAFQRYSKDVLAGGSPDAAAERVVFALRLGPLVETAYVDKSRSAPNSQKRYVVVYWKGQAYSETFWLDPTAPTYAPPKRTATLGDFKTLVRALRVLEEKGPRALELRGGNTFVTTGRDAEKRSGGS